MSQFRRRTVELLLAWLHVAVIVRLLANVDVLRVVRQLAEIVQMRPSGFQLSSNQIESVPTLSRTGERVAYLFLRNTVVDKEGDSFLSHCLLQLRRDTIDDRLLRHLLRS